MIEIPLGKAFESFIDWLKDHFTGLFDSIQAVLDFSINALERILLLDHEAIYPAIVMALLVGLVSYFLLRRFKRNTRIALAVIAIVFLGALETWRFQKMESSLTPAEAESLAAALTEFREDLRGLAPQGYDALAALFTEAAALQPGDESWARELNRVERRVTRLRDGDFARAADLVEDLEESIDEAGMDLPDSLSARLQSEHRRLLALTGIEEAERLEQEFTEVTTTERRYGFFNQRTYEDTIVYLNASVAAADELGADAAQVAAWKQLRGRMQSLDPSTLSAYPTFVMLLLLTALAFLAAGLPLAVFAFLGFFLIASMQYWPETMETLALVIASTAFALLIGVPAGIWSARSRAANSAIRPLLDFMQTMPAFVYLIPAVFFFGLGRVPGSIATLIFAMPPAVRLTALGIRQVPTEVVEAAEAFGATPRQLLFKAQLPIAMPTILAGLNQTIMLALSMVVIGAMIGAGGLGEVVLRGIDQMNIDVGFEGGVAVVILAIYLDRITQQLGAPKRS